MSGKLYRGVCCEIDEANNGKLRPKGNRSEVVMLHNGKIKYDGKFNYGSTENNAVRAHHIEPGMRDECFISFTRSREKALRFATRDSEGEKTCGYIYEIDEALLQKYGVVAHEPPNPEYPLEQEVTLRGADNGDLPDEIILSKRSVSPEDI